MGCGCLIALIFSVRIAIFVVWLFGQWFSQAFETSIWPFLGFLLMPWTTFVYALAANACGIGNDFSGSWDIWMFIAVVVDLVGWQKVIAKNCWTKQLKEDE